jgi:hypothetical protein
VPERFARAPTGVPFDPASCATRHPERLAHIAAKLSWLTPLEALTTDDLRILGLVNAAGRPLQSADLEDGGETEADDAPPPESAQYAAA